MPLRLAERLCENCQNPYQPRWRKQRFCPGGTCRNEWHRRNRPLLRLTEEERKAIEVMGRLLERLKLV